MKKETSKKTNKKQIEHKKKTLWIIKVFIMTLLLAMLFLIITESIIQLQNLWFSIIVVVVLIGISILFDMIGTAASACDIVPFISEASRQVKGASTAVELLKNAEKVSSFCNDIVGDICGIISGGCAGAVVAILVKDLGLNSFWTSIIVSAVISSITVGGKAIGKFFGIGESHAIIRNVAVVLSIFKKKK